MSKWILITGATGGIGEATARFLKEQGYSLVLIGRNIDKLNKLEADLAPNTYVFSYDLKDLHHIETIFNFISDKGIKLDGMVHAAGINRDIAIRMNDVDVMQEVTAVNYMSFVELMKYFMKKKYSNDGGSVVAISSYATRVIAAAMCTYTASKAALEAAVQVASKESAKRKIRVNAILPACVDTDMINNADYMDKDDIFRFQPYGIVPPIEIAYLSNFLLSDFSGHVTGALIPVTAGA